jgi:hypothetical protein
MENELHETIRHAIPHQPLNDFAQAARDDLTTLQHPRLTFHIWDDINDPRNCDEHDVLDIHRQLSNMLEWHGQLYTHCSDACIQILHSYVFRPYLNGAELSWNSPQACMKDTKLHLLKVVGTEVAIYLGRSNSQVLRSVEECDHMLHSRQPNIDESIFVHWQFLLSRVESIGDAALHALLCAILCGNVFNGEMIDSEIHATLHQIRDREEMAHTAMVRSALRATQRMRLAPSFHQRDHVPISPNRNRGDESVRRHMGNGHPHHPEAWMSASG